MRQFAHFVLIPSKQKRIWHQTISARQEDTSLFTDSKNRANKVLIGSHSSRNPIHNNTNSACGHRRSLAHFLLHKLLFLLLTKWEDAVDSQVELRSAVDPGATQPRCVYGSNKSWHCR